MTRVDRSLWLLLALRSRAWARNWVRKIRSLKGALLAVVGGLVFLPMIVTALFAPRVQVGAQVEALRLYGPLGLFGYCLLNVLLSAGDRAITYSPAEVNFLFCGPYPPRQLLLYKVAAGVGAAALTTPFMLLAFRHHTASTFAAFVGLFLALMLLYLFSIALGLTISTVGALAFNRGRKLLLLAVLAAAALAVAPLGEKALALSPGELLDRALRSPTVGVIVGPFRPFVMAFTADRLWPDLALWSAASLGVDLALLGVVLALNARFLEASAAASARLYERVKRLRRGEVWAASAPSKARFSVPMLPWWGGIGPNLWRQLTTASRSLSKLMGLGFLFLIPVVTVLLTERKDPTEVFAAGPSLSILFGIAMFAPTMVGFDFRPDLARMEDLKTLPIPPTRLALGQVVTPVLVLSAVEWFALALVAGATRPGALVAVGAAALVLPLNLLLVAVENLYFLWFPYRMSGFNTFDFQAMGRQMLLLMAKLASLAAAAAVAAALGAVVYYVTGGSWAAVVAAVWLVLAACGLAVLPLVAHAFSSFDVAEGPPD
jgi:hypothetical protein